MIPIQINWTYGVISLDSSDGVDIHYAIMYIQKNSLDIQLYFPHDSLMTERAKTVMDDIVKSIKIKKKWSIIILPYPSL